MCLLYARDQLIFPKVEGHHKEQNYPCAQRAQFSREKHIISDREKILSNQSKWGDISEDMKVSHKSKKRDWLCRSIGRAVQAEQLSTFEMGQV